MCTCRGWGCHLCSLNTARFLSITCLCQPGCFTERRLKNPSATVHHSSSRHYCCRRDSLSHKALCIFDFKRGQCDLAAWVNPLHCFPPATEHLCAQSALGLLSSEFRIDEWLSGGLWLELEEWKTCKWRWMRKGNKLLVRASTLDVAVVQSIYHDSLFYWK